MNTNNTTLTLHQCGHQTCAPCTMENYESVEIDYVCEYLDKLAKAEKITGLFIDVGAHVGLWSVQISDWYRFRYDIKPCIYALEPDKLNFRQLYRNAKQDPDTGIIPIPLAAWNKNKTLCLKRESNPGRHYVTEYGMGRHDVIEVKGIMLDSATESNADKNIDVIKIDVEGAELNVMNGARDILTSNENLLVVLEYSHDHMNKYGYKPIQLTNFMIQHGYRPARDVDKQTVKTLAVGALKRVIFVKGDVI